MADDDPKPPPPEIIVEGDWPHFLRRPIDPGERARQEIDRQRGQEHEQYERQHTGPARRALAAQRRLVAETIFRVAEVVAVKRNAWQVAGEVIKHPRATDLKINRPAAYHILRQPKVWARLSSLSHKR